MIKGRGLGLRGGGLRLDEITVREIVREWF